MLIEIGVLLAEADIRDTDTWIVLSMSKTIEMREAPPLEYQNLFCSQRCEREFVRTTLASVTLEECLRIQERLEALLVGARQTYRMNCDAG